MSCEVKQLVLSPVLTTRCNLRCNYCGYGCSSKNSNFDADPEKVIKGFAHLHSLREKYKGDHKVVLGLLGGEPLLYPHLIEVMTYVHDHLPLFNRDIVTNGLMAPKMSNKLIDAILANDYQLDISRYNLPNYDYDKLGRYLTSLGIKWTFIHSPMQELDVKTNTWVHSWFHHHYYILNGQVRPEGWTAADCRAFLKGMACVPLWEDKLYTCSNVFEVQNMQWSDKTHMDIPIVRGRELFDITYFKSIEDILAVLNTKYAFCDHCVDADLVPWSTNIKVKSI